MFYVTGFDGVTFDVAVPDAIGRHSRFEIVLKYCLGYLGRELYIDKLLCNYVTCKMFLFTIKVCSYNI